MVDAENTLLASKKRAAGKQLSRDNPGLDDEEEVSEQEMGTFKRASDEVIANRKIVKVRRHQTSSTSSVPSSNPFAGIQLVPHLESNLGNAKMTTGAVVGEVDTATLEDKKEINDETKKEKDERNKQVESKIDEPETESPADKETTDSVDDAVLSEPSGVKVGEGGKTENKAEKDVQDEQCENEAKKDADDEQCEKGEQENGDGIAEKNTETPSFNSFQRLSSSQNAFTGLAGTGFSRSTFSFGSIQNDGSGSGTGSLFGFKNDQPFAIGLSNNGSSALFGTSGTSANSKNERSGFPPLREVPVETGEEDEKAIFTADSVLFEFLDGVWKERGKGELKVNTLVAGMGKARLVMRARGNYRLILNASLYPDMKLTNMDKRGITFACANSANEGKSGLSTFALKFKDASLVKEFRAVVTEHKDKTAIALKTPENSPKALDD